MRARSWLRQSEPFREVLPSRRRRHADWVSERAVISNPGARSAYHTHPLGQRFRRSVALGEPLPSNIRYMTKTAFKIRFKAKLFPPAESEKGEFLDLSHPAKERQRQAPLAGHDGDRRHHQWQTFSSHARTRRPKKPLAQGGSEAARSGRAQTQATLSLSRSRRRQKNRNPRCRQICERLSRPPPRRRGRYGRTSRATRAGIGSTGSPPPSKKRPARAGSKMPARCSRPGSDAFAASTGRGSTVKA